MTDDPALNPSFVIDDEAALRALFPSVGELAQGKCIDHLDAHARAFIARAPFLCLGTQSGGPSDHSADISPRGDPCGFVKVLDDSTLAIPDRPGNNRLDSLANIIENPSVGLLFMIPGFDDTMRVNGRAQITVDPAILGLMAVNERLPRVAIVVRVHEVFIHCAKAFRRARLWDPEALQDRREMPSLIKIVLDQTASPAPDAQGQAALDAKLEESYVKKLY